MAEAGEAGEKKKKKRKAELFLFCLVNLKGLAFNKFHVGLGWKLTIRDEIVKVETIVLFWPICLTSHIIYVMDCPMNKWISV